ncbi:alpha-L-fucosidase [Hymenobacter setariae]|uniref:alpha-L-fucosidase n=1 Tax=Hymenobacter setariae TaxID=2594794 RepID=A0A558BSN1_9BACT|nr:alpha-L-fucosidase [Hymenobacter setariae]TVT39527.1 alpha-L-fucosidase [Hymenobacter setariae]
MKKATLALALLAAASALPTYAQQQGVHQQSTEYEAPTDPLVVQKLDKWRDQKFGLILHWGLYAIPGIIESWTICSEDWIERDSTIAYEDYKKRYWDYSKQFNPTKFNPEQWASVAKKAGMRYLVFTTKHHDGYNMFDTKQSDFKISSGPFKNDPRADVAKYVFDAFRKQDFMIGAYFSKPDWHTQDFWWSKYATPNRNVNYDIKKYPWRWKKYQDFTYNQISELMHNYGRMDILWLDGGWVRPKETVNAEVRSWGAPIPEFSQDVNMPRIATMARQAQPGLLMVDRTVHGPYENYQTPEQKVPDHQLANPWESCLTLANNWGYVPNDVYKSPTKIIHSLVEVVAKGGSLLLGVGPRPDGTLDQEAVTRLEAIGKWLDVNGAAIYSTRSTPLYQDGSTYFTQGKKGTRYAIACLPENQAAPTTLTWTGNVPKKGSKLTLLQTGKSVKWSASGDKVTLTMPAGMSTQAGAYPALAFAFVPEK